MKKKSTISENETPLLSTQFPNLTHQKDPSIDCPTASPVSTSEMSKIYGLFGGLFNGTRSSIPGV